jgi:hypothetical protein
MLKLEALSAWMKANGITGVAYALGETPHEPDELVTLTDVPGLPMAYAEDDVDLAGLQVRTRSPRASAASSRDLIHRIDRLLLDDALWPFDLGGYRLLSFRRMGGPPAYMQTDHQGRASYVCNYLPLRER